MGDPVHKSLREKRQTETKEEYERASFEFDPAPLKYYGKLLNAYTDSQDFISVSLIFGLTLMGTLVTPITFHTTPMNLH